MKQVTQPLSIITLLIQSMKAGVGSYSAAGGHIRYSTLL